MTTRYELNFVNLHDYIKETAYESWSLGSTLTACFTVILIYLTVVLKLIPNFMKDREPYQLKRIMLVYNIVQVIYSVYLVAIYTLYMWDYGVVTTRCHREREARMEVIGYYIYPYFIAKHLDLLDTVFFALRKKNDQVSFLHVYHHGVMLVWTWLHQVYHPTDQFVFVGFLNSFVHMLMYAYYGISSLGPQYAKFVWWKKHLTKVQLVQFILVLIQLPIQHQVSPCPIPSGFHWFCVTNIAAFFLLFLKFYFSSYRKNRMANQEVKGIESEYIESCKSK